VVIFEAGSTIRKRFGISKLARPAAGLMNDALGRSGGRKKERREEKNGDMPGGEKIRRTISALRPGFSIVLKTRLDARDHPGTGNSL